MVEARGIVRRFGSFTALDGVNFDVRPGEIHALLGENGAGKSTLMNVLSGLLRPSAGELFLEGQPVRFASPADATARGVGMVHQHFLLVPSLSVGENLLLGASARLGGPWSYPLRSVLGEAKALAEQLGWKLPWDALAGSLSVGVQQRIEILKALRGGAKLLLFDEPTSVLTPTETPELFDVIRRLAQEGRGVVFISHKLDEVLSLADRITVLRRGKVVASFARSEADEALLATAMVGEESEAARMLAIPLRSAPQPPVMGEPEGEVPPNLEDRGQKYSQGEPRLTVTELTLNTSGGKPALDRVSLCVAAGEILGIAGVDGNGQTELAECLTGLKLPSSGTITIENQKPTPTPAGFLAAGVTSVPADRQRRGLALSMTLTENLALGTFSDARFRKGPFLSWSALRERTREAIARFDIRAEGPGATAGSLSGGNQQKVVLARALADSPKVIIAVNPTRGLDVGAIAFVHQALRQAQSGGAAILLISTELDEVLALSGRIGVLFEGRLTPASDTSRSALGRLMGGVL